jgi:hypothetical protein
MRVSPLLTLLAITLLAPTVVVRGLAAQALATGSPVTALTGQSHRGWTDAVILRNRLVEAVIVPSVGRVMQFRFLGDTDGPFWENEKLLGRPMPADPWKVAVGSFGGDKTWPAPQSEWKWPPPDVFDAAPLTAIINADRSVTLTSPVSPRLGLRTIRRISLDPTEAVMRIATTFEKISGDPSPVAVWVITQLRDPAAIFMPVPPRSIFPEGYAAPWKGPAQHLRREADWIRFTRNPTGSHKTGNDATDLVWADAHQLLRISIPRVAGADYTHNGCSVEVYTNADPVPYVELETLGPLHTLRSGERATATNTYRLARRTAAALEQDVRALLASTSP